MTLNERKIKILEAIINDYIATAEPIGSRTIAKKYDLGVSSATIRNEMSDLEEMGFIIQPHASAGRVPSNKGYRLYVDHLMQSRALTPEEAEVLRRIIGSNVSQINYLMEETARAISYLTNYTTIASEPATAKEDVKIKHLQLVPMDEQAILLVLVFDDKAVKNHVIPIYNQFDTEELSRLSAALNDALRGQSAETLHPEVLARMLDTFERDKICDKTVLTVILQQVYETLHQERDIKVYTSGAKNILSFPEFSDLDKARALFQALEEKDVLITLLNAGGAGNLQIVIGEENTVEPMKDCSIIRASFVLGGRPYGGIGIIGPTRMDYAQVVSVLQGIVGNINAIINSLAKG